MSSWDTPAAESWKADGDDGGFKPDGGFEVDSGFSGGGSNGFDDAGANGFSGGGGDAGGGDDRTCRVCNQEGHIARDCPDKPAMECYNCGQVGHSKADCTNERVERPFTGTCNSCGVEGHRSSQCPDKPADVCRLCGTEGHKAAECTAKRTDLFKDAEVMTDDASWKAMKESGRDMDAFRRALNSYCRFMHNLSLEDPEVQPVKAHELEQAFRKDNFKVYLIAKEKEENNVYTHISLGGEINQKYLLTLQTSDKPRRQVAAKGWPKDAEENLKRLESAGFQLDRGVPKCDNCGELGHVRKSCKKEIVESSYEKPKITCVICSNEGHRARDCDQRPVDTCRRCKGEGHKAVDCTAPRDASDVECKSCGETGHFSRDCPTRERRTCRNCGSEDHIAKDCTEAPNPDKMQCRNCDEYGHTGKDCPKPRDYSRVTCRNCGEKGHTVVRCKMAATDAPSGDGGNGGFDDAATAASAAGGGGWENNEDAVGTSVEANGTW